jgi:hypothetical protein
VVALGGGGEWRCGDKHMIGKRYQVSIHDVKTLKLTGGNCT